MQVSVMGEFVAVHAAHRVYPFCLNLSTSGKCLRSCLAPARVRHNASLCDRRIPSLVVSRAERGEFMGETPPPGSKSLASDAENKEKNL
jgi:hypothetical protein